MALNGRNIMEKKRQVVIKLKTKIYTKACYFHMEIWRK